MWAFSFKAHDMLLAIFRARFPEFNLAPDEFVQAYLDAALTQLSSESWGALIDEGQAYLAAHMMALSPSGVAARLVANDGSSTYEDHFNKLMRRAFVAPTLAYRA